MKVHHRLAWALSRAHPGLVLRRFAQIFCDTGLSQRGTAGNSTIDNLLSLPHYQNARQSTRQKRRSMQTPRSLAPAIRYLPIA